MIVIFADIAGFTALAEERGDLHATEVLDAVGSIVAEIAGKHGLRQVKTIGDAFLLATDDARRALAAVVELNERVITAGELPTLHIGLHCGSVVERDGDVYGRTVNLAARVAAAARPGQVLSTADALRAGVPPDAVAVGAGCLRLRGVAAPVRVYSIRRSRQVLSRSPVSLADGDTLEEVAL